MYSVLNKKLYVLLCFVLSISLTPFVKAKEPILIYNQFPLVWNMDFDAMAKYLPTIAGMGFNVVWVNPFFKSTNNGFLAVDEGKGIHTKVRSSLYEMYDPSLIWIEDNSRSTGNPSGDEETRDQINATVKTYTALAKINGLTPIFDLVLNHAAPDSPLVVGNFSHFREKGIDTSKWFDDRGRWGKGFDYTTEEKRKEIFKNLWSPLITRAIIAFGFDGVRIDYGTAVNQEVLQQCIELIKRLKSDAIVTIAFGEALIPADADIVRQLESCSDTHFTHLTNNAFSLRQKSIMEGRHDRDKHKGYWWFLDDLGLKKATTKQSSKFWNEP